MTLAQQITEARKAKGLSKIAAADLLEVTPQTMSRLEKGTRKPSYPLLQLLVARLGVDMSQVEVAAGVQ